MVYCGKASLGCSSCRKRRIKCDRRQPECTQCVRLSKACPGYRDQLSLMFRDETVKVEKRVRASWGLNDTSSSSSSSSSSSNPSTQPAPTRAVRSSNGSATPTTKKRSPSSIPTPPCSIASTSPTSTRYADARSTSSPSPGPPSSSSGTVQRAVDSQEMSLSPVSPLQTPSMSRAQLGVSFYVQRFIIGYPDEARNPMDLHDQIWFRHPSSQATMAALGLAALGNLNGDKQLQHVSQIKYGEALVGTNKALQDPVNNLETAIRTTVMLALFQCVHHTHESHENAQVHLLGCLALIKAALPIRSAPANGVRGVLQLCYSILIPCLRSGMNLPAKFFDWIQDGASSGFLPRDEQPSVDLLLILARFVQLHVKTSTTVFVDGREATAAVMRRLLDLDAALDRWEATQDGKWIYEVYTDESLPPEGVYRQTYHRYSDVWSSRIWNHYRWGRILTNQMLLEMVIKYPMTAASVLSVGQQDGHYETIRRVAVDTLISVPTHYKHPKLTWKHLDICQTHGGAGAGAVGIPHLLFHLQVAACAPGIPYDIWKWAVDLMETTWADLGMLHAKSLAEVSRNHRESLGRAVPEKILKVELVTD